MPKDLSKNPSQYQQRLNKAQEELNRKMRDSTGKTGNFTKIQPKIKTGPITTGEIIKETIKGIPSATQKVFGAMIKGKPLGRR